MPSRSSSRPVGSRPTSPSSPTRVSPTSPPSFMREVFTTSPPYDTPINKANLRTKRRQKRRQRSTVQVLTPTAGSLSETIPTVPNLSETPLPPRAPPQPVSLRSVEDRQKSKERRPPSPYPLNGHIGGKLSALVDLRGDEMPSSDLADASCGLSQTKEVSEPYWNSNLVVAWRDADLPTPIYVRVDRSRASHMYHTYPNLHGPFQSLEDVQSAVDAHARGSSKELPPKKRVHEFLYWPNGTKKVCTPLEIAKTAQEDVRRLVEALLDKRNDDEEHTDELKDIVHWQLICEDFDVWYYHLNITVKTKGADDDKNSAKLFFAEVTQDQNDMPGYFLSRFCKVRDSNAVCHGCTINGSTDMKHPRAHSYKGGHNGTDFAAGPGICNDLLLRELMNSVKDIDDEAKLKKAEEDEKMIKAEEDRIRKCYDYLDDDKFMEEFFGKNRMTISGAF